MRTIWKGRRTKINENNNRYEIVHGGVQIVESLTEEGLRELQASLSHELGLTYKPKMQTKRKAKEDGVADKTEG